MKQPFEDIHGYAREEDDLLSLEDVAIPRRAMMMALAKHLQRATLVGNPAPIVQRMYERLSSPQIGDLVAETSAIRGRDEDNQVKGFGILLEHRVEWATSDEEWAREVRDGEWDLVHDQRPTDHAWYVIYGPRAEDVCRWTNCSFITIPTDHRMFDAPVGTTTDGGGVLLTRDDLLAGLGDAGFGIKPPT